MATQTAAKVLDRNRMEARARVVDVAALLVLVAIGARLIFDFYTIGYEAGAGIRPNWWELDLRFSVMMAQAFIAGLGVAWISYRLFLQGARRAGG